MHSKETDLHLKTCKECIKNDVCFMPQDEVCPKYASKNITYYAYEQGAKDTAKEIEEMAKVICPCIYDFNDCESCDLYDNKRCLPFNIVEELYNAGYRKQSENTVEVVRCKDCVYFKRSVSALFPHASVFICDCPYGLQKNVCENDFCCHGAKMKGGE